MPVETAEDRLAYLDPDLFGVNALYTSRDGTVVDKPIVGIFDAEAAHFDPNRWPGHEYQMQHGAQLTSTGPEWTCRESDLVKGGKQRDKVEILPCDQLPEGGRFKVHERKPDGTGMIVLTLTEDDS